MKILLVGGGSGGSVVPLLAVAKEIKKNASGGGIFIRRF
jgi:UDP-N-acetylglucosamine:LPS N-acetylglucosamine transferase